MQRAVRWLVLPTLVALMSFGRPAPARAYRTTADLPGFEGSERVVWAGASVELRLGAPPAGVSEEAWLRAAQGAADTWNAVPCASVRIEVERSDGEAVGGDGISHVSVVREGWTAMGLQEDAAGTTDLAYARVGEAEWQITETDVLLNGGMEFAIDPPMLGGARDLRTVLTHEFGHVLGLAHNCEPDGAEGAPTCDASHEAVTLFPLYRGPEMRILSDDDVAGACFLYPVAPGCTSDEQCAVGACEGGRCVGEGVVGDECTSAAECRDGICDRAGYCTRECGSCPEGWSCDGVCRPVGAVFGERCVDGDDCASGLCLQRGEAGSCTRTCGTACPAGARCRRVDGREVCVAPASGCAASGGRGGAGLCLMTLLLWRASWRNE